MYVYVGLGLRLDFSQSITANDRGFVTLPGYLLKINIKN